MSLLNVIETFHKSLPQVDCFTCDIGNTNPHLGIWREGILKEVLPIANNQIKERIEELPKDKTIICSVSKEIPSSDSFKKFSDLKEGTKSFLDMPVDYESSLGHDRLTLAAYLYNSLNKIPAVIIDAGTFITMDFINELGLQGGFIIPGFKTLEKSYQSGSQLFAASDQMTLFNKSSEEILNWPQTTKEAINQGHKFLMSALLEKVECEIQKIKNKHPDIDVILTGGSGELFANQLKTENYHPHLLHYSLYFQQVSGLS